MRVLLGKELLSLGKLLLQKQVLLMLLRGEFCKLLLTWLRRIRLMVLLRLLIIHVSIIRLNRMGAHLLWV